MASPTTVPESTPIAQLNPDLRPDDSSVTGIVTLIWPYAASKGTFSLLLVEPDFRLRSKRGQVRVHFQGSSAKAVARSGISSGDQLLLSLRGAEWAKDATAATTPGRGIDWQLQYGERLVLQIQRPSQQAIHLDIDHPTPSPEPPIQTSTPARSPPHNNHYASSTERAQLKAQVWESPAFLKRSHFLATEYDPFAEEEFPDNERTKRIKFGHGSGQWRFAERTPSPEKEFETPPLETVSPSRLPIQDRPRGEEVQSRIQQAHDTGSPSETSSVEKNALTVRIELEAQSEVDPATKDTSIAKGEETSISFSQVNDVRYMIPKVDKDESFRDVSAVTPRSQHTKPDVTEVELLEERGEVDGPTRRPTSPTFKAHYVHSEASQESDRIEDSSSVPIEILSSDSSSSAPESDQESDINSDLESDGASHQESDSLFDEQSESEESNAAMYSGPASEFGLDGSTFSRHFPFADFAQPPSIVKRLEEGLEADDMNTEDARDITSPLQGIVEQVEKAEEPSTAKKSTAESLLSEDEGSGDDIDMLEGHDAAQRRSSIPTPSLNQFESPEGGESHDEAIEDLTASQRLADDRTSGKNVDVLRNRSAEQRVSSNPSSPSKRTKSQGLQSELVHRSQDAADDEAALEMIPEKRSAKSPEIQSPSSSREKIVSPRASDEEITRDESPRKGLNDSRGRQESPILRQKEVAPDARLTREDSKVLHSQGMDIRDRAESLGMVNSEIQQTSVEIIDLESGDEDDISPSNVAQIGSQALVEENISDSASTSKVSADVIPLPSASDSRNEPMLKPVTAVEGIPPASILVEPEAHGKAPEPEQDGSRTQPPVITGERYQEEHPTTKEAPLVRSQAARVKSKERELPSEEKARLKQSATVESELKPIPIDELPSTVPDSFEDRTSKSQLLTPSSTQQTISGSQPSSVSLHHSPEDNTLPTPRLTQSTSTGIVPQPPLAPPEELPLAEKPAPPKKTSALIEKLKAMRKLSNQSPKPRSSDASVLDPWFAPRQLSQVVPDSEDGSEAESSPEREAQAHVPKIVGGKMLQTPEKPLAKSFIRSPSQPKHFSSIQSSPQYLPPSQPPPPGFRTTLSYFVPLATLPSHFATTVDVLATALSSTPVTRATSGPKDYNQTLYITDPSSLASQQSITTAQIFRPNNRCFPLVGKGEALLLRDFKVQPFQKRLLLLSTESSAWAVFRKGADVQIRGPPVELGAEERGFARGLWDWWASLGEDARKRLENAVPEYKKPNGTAKPAKSKAGGKNGDAPIKKEEIEGLGVDLPGSQSKKRQSMKERSLALDGVEEKDMVHESIEPPKRVLRARGAKGANGRSESARESRFGTVFTGGLGEPDETQGSAHELRDGKAYRAKGR